MLVSAIFNEEGIAQYYLPEGTWTNYLTGEKTEGGCWREESHGYLSIPLWVRENSVIPVGIQAERAEYEFEDNLELKVFELKDQAETRVYRKNEEMLYFKITGKEGKVSGEIKGRDGCRVRLVNCILENVQGAEVYTDGKDTVLTLTKPGSFTGETR